MIGTWRIGNTVMPKSSLIVVGVAVVGIAIFGDLALSKCCNVLSLVCTRHSVDLCV